MMRALLIALTLTASFGAVAQEGRQAFLCVDEAVNGFNFKDGSYKPTLFKESRFSAIWDKDSKVLEVKGGDLEEHHKCSLAWSHHPHLYQCSDGTGSTIMLDLRSLRFSRSALYGHVNSAKDSLSVAYDTCQKF